MLRFLVLILLKFLFIMYVMIFLSKMWICEFSRQIKGTTGGVLKKDSDTVVFLRILRNFKEHLFIEHLRKATFRQMPIFLAHFIIIIERPMKDFYTMNLTHFCLMFSFLTTENDRKPELKWNIWVWQKIGEIMRMCLARKSSKLNFYEWK